MALYMVYAREWDDVDDREFVIDESSGIAERIQDRMDRIQTSIQRGVWVNYGVTPLEGRDAQELDEYLALLEGEADEPAVPAGD